MSCPTSADENVGWATASGLTTSSDSDFVSVRAPSVTFTTNATGPLESVVAVPDSVPSAPSVMPGGGLPLRTDHVCEPPPAAASFTEYGTPTVAGVSLSVVTVSFSVIEIVNGRCEGALQEFPAGGQVPPTQPLSRSSSQNEKSPAT